MSLADNVIGRLPIGGEFQGRNGDCAEYALMVARCALEPWNDCSGAELNRLTSEAIAAGEVDCPGGCMTDAQFAWLASREHLDYEQRPFDEMVLVQHLGAGVPVCCGFSNGQALPGNEPNVFGHAVAILGHDATGYTLANGDSVNGRAGLLDYQVSSDVLRSAHPTTITAILGGRMLQIGDVSDWFEEINENDWLCKQTGFHIVHGLLMDYRTFPVHGALAGMTGLTLPLENEVTLAPNVARQRFQRGTRIYDPGRVYDNPVGSLGACYSANIDYGTSTPPIDEAGIKTAADNITAAAEHILTDADTIRAKLAGD